MAGRDVDGAFDIKLVAFDIAGTTVSVADQVPDAFRYAFSVQGFDVSHAQIRAVRGVSKREAIQKLLVTLSPDRDAAGLTDKVDVIFSSFKETLLARSMPVLFTTGRYDQATPETLAYYDSLTPDSRLVILENSAHITMQDEPERYVEVVGEFLNEIESQR